MKKIILLGLILLTVPSFGQLEPHFGFGLTAAYRNGLVSNSELNNFISTSNATNSYEKPLAFRGRRGGYTLGFDVYYAMVSGGIRLSRTWNDITATDTKGLDYKWRCSEFHFTPYLGVAFQRNFFHLQLSGGMPIGNNKVQATYQITGLDKRFVDKNYEGLFFGFNLRAEASVYYVFFAVEKVFGSKSGGSDTSPMTDNFIGVYDLNNANANFSGMRYELGLRFNLTDEL